VGRGHEGIKKQLGAFLVEQPVFFVGTAPSSNDGHVNVSPKGVRGTFTVLGDHRVAYLDLTGSGVETIAHLQENGRITLMFCAFEGPARIVRLAGRGEAVVSGDPRYEGLVAGFPKLEGIRSVIVVEVDRIADSCGYGVPRMALLGDRDQMATWAREKGQDALAAYRRAQNVSSIDGLPGLDP
jgi:hypothetical protein